MNLFTQYGSVGEYTISGTAVPADNNAPTFNSAPIGKADATQDAAYAGSLAGDASDAEGK